VVDQRLAKLVAGIEISAVRKADSPKVNSANHSGGRRDAPKVRAMYQRRICMRGGSWDGFH
jgi:hypothetical protein